MRENLFVTAKVRNTDRGYDATPKAFEESRAKLHLDYVDLCLSTGSLPGRRG